MLPALIITDIGTYADFVMKTAGRDIIVTGQLRAAYFPFPLFARRVFILGRTPELFYRPNILVGIVFLAAYAVSALALLPLSLLMMALGHRQGDRIGKGEKKAG